MAGRQKGSKKAPTAASRHKNAHSGKAEIRRLCTELDDARQAAAKLARQLRAARKDLQQSLDYQAAISEILRVISQSSSDAQPIFQTIVETAHRLCWSEHAFVFRLEDGKYRLVAAKNASAAQIKRLRQSPVLPDRGSITGRVAIERRPIQVADVTVDPEYTLNVSGVRTTLGVPLLADGVAVGIIVLTRALVEPFTASQIDLVSTFATQALIAIENARLFDEVQSGAFQLGRTVEELRALGEVTRAINSTVDLESVLSTIVSKAVQISATDAGAIYMFDHATKEFWLRTTYGVNDEILAAIKDRRVHLNENQMGVALQRRIAIQFPDVEGQTSSAELDVILRAGFRSLLVVPLLDAERAVGALVLRRKTPGVFLDHVIEVMTTFAAQSALAIRNAALFEEVQVRTNDLSESLRQQTATADVLKLISRSSFDVQTVLQTLTESAANLCNADMSTITREGEPGQFYHVTNFNFPEDWVEYTKGFPLKPGRGTVVGRTLIDKQPVQIPDVLADPEYTHSEQQKKAGYRTFLGVPLLREGQSVGAFCLCRKTVAPFTPQEIALVATFADQAVIAIENVRLFDELKARSEDLRQSLEYQTATGEVLGIISRSPTDVRPVFEAIAASALRLCRAKWSVVTRFDGTQLHLAALHNLSDPEGVDAIRRIFPRSLSRGGPTDRTILTGTVVNIPDVLKDPEYIYQSISKTAGYRSHLAVPMIRDGKAVGAITVAGECTAAFTERHVNLLKAFADQAVIAIENTQLFKETKEALARQTATSEVLQAIGSSVADTAPVFEKILDSCEALFSTEQLGIFLVRDGLVHAASWRGAALEASVETFPKPIEETASGQAIANRELLHVPSAEAMPNMPRSVCEMLERIGDFSAAWAPMLRGERGVGAICTFRQPPQPFTNEEQALLRTFADQAVIAIENTRLFEEVKARTEDLQEALQQQTATADVLKAISRSAFDLETVLNALIEAAARLCEADQGTIARQQGDAFVRVASWGFSTEFTELVRTIPVEPEAGSAIGRALLERRTIHIPDVYADPEYTFAEARRIGGFKSIIAVPMLREGKPIGVLALTRVEDKSFSSRQIELVTTFADQAAIAIENVRLFDEVQHRTQELSRSLDELRAAQDRLIQTEKLASLGQLTAGIAHEIKNPLNFVNNFSALSAELTDELNDMLMRASMAETVRQEVRELTSLLKDNLSKVVQHGKRADSIVKNMLLHSRQDSGELRSADINALVDESLNLAYHGARAENPLFHVTLKRRFDPGAGIAEIYPQEITRVLLNLVSNGFYAVSKRNTENGDGTFEPCISATTHDRGESIEIRIRDNGAGIPSDVREKIFNPFFTTKPPGDGTGLGLSMSHDIIVKQHGGRIDVDTELGSHTEFIVTLPRKRLAR